MPETKQSILPPMAEPMVQTNQTIIAAGPTPPDYPKDMYDGAHIENDHFTFNAKLMAARAENEPKPYVPPPVPTAIQELTRLEMEAGRRNVARFAQIEEARKEINAVRKPEPWESKSTAIFQPGNVDEYKGTFKNKAQSVSKDTVPQPRQP